MTLISILYKGGYEVFNAHIMDNPLEFFHNQISYR